MAYSPRKLGYIERECLKEANRAMRTGDLSKEAFLQIRIQTCSPLERLIVLLGAVTSIAFASWLYFAKESTIAAIVLCALSLLLFVVSAFGKRSTVGSVFRVIDAQISLRILDALF